MKLSRYEQETIICYNEGEDTASVYTHDGKLIAKLKRLAEKYPDKVKPERKEHGEAVCLLHRSQAVYLRPGTIQRCPPRCR